MSGHLGAESQIRYFRCSSCGRWVSSAYTDIFRTDAKVRLHAAKPAEEDGKKFETVKQRLEHWLKQIDQQDPYQWMGVSPLDSSETIRNRYRELALERHPDRGGSPDEMMQLNVAYERIMRHRDGTLGPLTGSAATAFSTTLALASRSK
jgi:hypothetical protein